MRVRLIAIAILLTMTGCVSADFASSKMSVAYPPRTSPENIEMFRTSMPSKKFIEIGAVSACCTYSEELIQALRKKASEVGGDAIVAIDLDATNGATASVVRYQ